MHTFDMAPARLAAAAVGLLLLGQGSAAQVVVNPGIGRYSCDGTGGCAIGPVQISGPGTCSLVTQLQQPGTQTLQIDTLRRVSRLRAGYTAGSFRLLAGDHRVSVSIFSTPGHVNAVLDCHRR